jgi:uncharacterized protein (DUF736 family)
MAKIGAFSKTEHGYKGRVRTLTLNSEVELVLTEAGGEGAPQYRIYSGGSEIGAALEKTSESGIDYLSLKLDVPTFPAPIYASLFVDNEGDKYSLVRQRPTKKR